MITAALLSIVFSGALLAMLGVRDPKRLRASHAARRHELVLSAPMRRAAGWLVLAPALVLVALSQWWALLIWFGAICALGWLTANVLSS